MRLLIRLIILLKNNKGYRIDKYHIITNNKLGTCSFFNRIFLSAQLDHSTKEIALTHEKVHANHWHSIDVIWFELLTIPFWINPAIWLLKNELRNNHEFIADKITREQYGNERYINALLNHTFQTQSINFLPMFSNSQTLKNRIIMMKNNRPAAKYRYLILLPLLAAFIVTVACTQKTEKEEIVSIKKSKSISKQEVYSVVDQMPEYPGGMSAMMEYLGNNISYPETAKTENIEGKVFVSFVIDTNGKVTKVEVKKGVHPDLDKEALRIIESMPNWKPGMHEGKVVNVMMNLPIQFKLQ